MQKIGGKKRGEARVNDEDKERRGPGSWDGIKRLRIAVSRPRLFLEPELALKISDVVDAPLCLALQPRFKGCVAICFS